jgi:hypothetical protein
MTQTNTTQEAIRDFAEFLALVIVAFVVRNAVVLVSLSALALAALTAA